mgnify:CR=1 FL=1
MNLQYRIDLLDRLGKYILSGDSQWQLAKEKAGYENGWFVPAFTALATENIARHFLQETVLTRWAAQYEIPASRNTPLTAGIIMAGNIPLVGFHDWLCVFISGHNALVKPSAKDNVLIRHLVEKLGEWEPAVLQQTRFAEMLKGCDAYIATGSNNSSRYFEYYFARYPHIIRRNRTSVAVLDGTETAEEMEKLADDVHQYFGLGCRNVTMIYVPRKYDFIPLLTAFKKYAYLSDHHKYKNNYDYNLALHLLNKVEYMTSGSVLLVENPSLFSPISQLHYEFYDTADGPALKGKADEIQCITGHGFLPFGSAQSPGITDYADGIDTLQFLTNL